MPHPSCKRSLIGFALRAGRIGERLYDCHNIAHGGRRVEWQRVGRIGQHFSDVGGRAGFRRKRSRVLAEARFFKVDMTGKLRLIQLLGNRKGDEGANPRGQRRRADRLRDGAHGLKIARGLLPDEREGDGILVWKILVQRTDRYARTLGDGVGGVAFKTGCSQNVSGGFKDNRDGMARTGLNRCFARGNRRWSRHDQNASTKSEYLLIFWVYRELFRKPSAMSDNLSVAACGLADPQIAETLARLHAQAGRDGRVLLSALPAVAIGAVLGKSMFDSAEPYLSKAYIPVSEDVGRFMYQVARAARAKMIVEFGSSFGISSIYLAAAARASGGRFIGSEKDPDKARIATANLEAAGLSCWSDIREGDARESLAALDGPVDFLFLDGWKDLYIPILTLMMPKLAPGAIVFADNLKTFRKTLKPFADYMMDPENGFETTILPFESGIAFATWRGNPPPPRD
jgi:predicted O-methyltransferase YrrM